MSKSNYRSDRRFPMRNEVKNEIELLKSRLEKLIKILKYKNRGYCIKYLKKIIEEFIEG